jgi:hypothetical protein
MGAESQHQVVLNPHKPSYTAGHSIVECPAFVKGFQFWILPPLLEVKKQCRRDEKVNPLIINVLQGKIVIYLKSEPELIRMEV